MVDATNVMTAEQLYSIVAYLCTQGEQSDCDMENRVTAIPDAIKTTFDLDVDITFGMVDDAETGEKSDTEEAQESAESDTESDSA